MIEDKSANRMHVLFMMLVFCICNVSMRNLPSYLITVPVPECEKICFGINAYPLCGRRHIDEAKAEKKINGKLSRQDECQFCRARIVQVPRNFLSNSSNGKDHPQFKHQPWFWPVKRHNRLHAASTLELEAKPTTFLDSSLVEQNAVDDISWPNSFGQDASFYNLADGACLTHWKYGIFIGYGFAAVFAIGTLPAGFICDRRQRVVVASAALVVWSVATALQASATSFIYLLWFRAAVGLAQAFAMPVSISIIADYFAEEQNYALEFLSVGLYIGSGCASLSILFAQILGWRWAVLWAGLIGVAIAPVFYHTVREPERTKWSAPCFISDVMDEVFFKSRTASLLIMAGSAKMLAAYSLSAFLPIWYSRQGLQGYTNNTYAYMNAFVISAGGLLSTLIGSFIGHRWSQIDPRAPCWIGLLGAIFSLPLICMMLLTHYFSWSLLYFFLLLLVSESWFGPTVSLLQAAVRKSVHSQAVSLFITASTLAANLGPALVGFFDSGGASVGVHLLWVTLTANVVAALAFLWTAREISVDPVAAGLNRYGEDYDDWSRPLKDTTPWSTF